MSDIMKTRGALVDEMQSRINKISRKGASVPVEWQEKLSKLAESSDPKDVTDIRDWMHDNLPPAEYEVEKVTWDTFKDFADETIRAITLAAMTSQLLTGKKQSAAGTIIQSIVDLRASSETPAAALAALGKIRAHARDAMPDLITGE